MANRAKTRYTKNTNGKLKIRTASKNVTDTNTLAVQLTAWPRLIASAFMLTGKSSVSRIQVIGPKLKLNAATYRTRATKPIYLFQVTGSH